MTETKWTPGPWNRAGIPKQYGCDSINADGPCGIAKVFFSSEAHRRGEVEANINLICAAPDLYEALADILTAGMCVGERVERARAALAKARGEGCEK